MKEIAVKKSRQSNLELLRILSMLLVMLVHYLPLRMPTNVAMADNHPIKALFNLELHSAGIICVHCFILISGYFGIKSCLQSFLSLIFQIAFWTVSGYLIARFLIAPYYAVAQSYEFSDFILAMWHQYQSRWFVSAYVTLYIISPVINRFIEYSNEKQLLNFILVFYLYSTVYGYFIKSMEFATGLSAISLMGLYLVGAWLRKSSVKIVMWNKKYDMIGFIVCTLILTLVSFVMLRMGITVSIYGYLNPIVIIESMFLFQFFRKCQFGYIHWINYFAAGAFSAFLLHCHPYLSNYCNELWKCIDRTFDYSMIYVGLSFVLLYITSVLIDKIRLFLWNSMMCAKYLINNTLPPPVSR